MKKLIFLLTMIVSFGTYAQKDSIVMSSQAASVDYWHCRTGEIRNGNFGGSGKDAFIWQRDYVSGFGKAIVYLYSAENGGLNIYPDFTMMILTYLTGAGVLKTADSVNSMQAICNDTLLTFINTSAGLAFNSFCERLSYKPKMISIGEVKNQLVGDETLLIDSTFARISVYHFNGLTSDSLQTIYTSDSITCIEYGDFNGDGLGDLVVVCKPSSGGNSKAKFYIQGANGLVFWREISLNRLVCSARVKDLQADGFPDLIVSSTDSLTKGLTIVNFIDSVSAPIFDNYDGYKIGDFTVDGDFNRDGYYDIIGLRNDSSSMVIYRNDQNGHFVRDRLFPSGTTQPLIYHSIITANFCEADVAPDNKTDIAYVSGKDSFYRKNITPYYSDPKISSIELSSALQARNNYNDTVKVKINNIGEAVANSDSLLSVKLSFTLKSFGGNTLFEKTLYQSFDSISRGDSITLSFVLDSIFIQNSSKLEIAAEVDPNGYLQELTLKNNILKNISEFVSPDLTIAAIILDTNSYYWYQQDARIIVENIGYLLVDSTSVKTKIFLKRGDSIYFSKECSIPIFALDSSETRTLNLNLEENLPELLNFLTSDSLIIVSTIDYDSAITELNEENNEKTLRVKIGDLASLGLSPELSKFNAYPNPTSGVVNITLPKDGMNVEVFDTFGRRIWSKENAAQSIQIDLSNYPSGIYYLRINNLTKKIVKR